MMKFHQGKYSMEEIKIIAIHVIKKYYKKNLNEMIITGKDRGTVQQKSSGKIPLRIHSLLFSTLIYRRRLASEPFSSKGSVFWLLVGLCRLRVPAEEWRGRRGIKLFFFLGLPLGSFWAGWVPWLRKRRAFKWFYLWVLVATPSHCPFRPTVTTPPKGVLHTPIWVPYILPSPL